MGEGHTTLVINHLRPDYSCTYNPFAGKAWSACWQGLVSERARRGQQAGKGWSVKRVNSIKYQEFSLVHKKCPNRHITDNSDILFILSISAYSQYN